MSVIHTLSLVSRVTYFWFLALQFLCICHYCVNIHGINSVCVGSICQGGKINQFGLLDTRTGGQRGKKNELFLLPNDLYILNTIRFLEFENLCDRPKYPGHI